MSQYSNKLYDAHIAVIQREEAATRLAVHDFPACQVIEANGTPWMAQATQIMVDGYFPYVPAYPPEKAEEKYQTLYKLLSADPYEPLQRSFTFVALFPDPEQPGRKVAAGTIRLIVGVQGTMQTKLSAIPAFDLLNVSSAWPHIQDGCYDGQIGEWCRFAITAPYRGAAVAITESLFRAAYQKSRDFSLHSIYAIAPRKVQMIGRRAGFPFKEVEGLSFQDTQYAHSFFDPLPGYWQQGPRLYHLPTISPAKRG